MRRRSLPRAKNLPSTLGRQFAWREMTGAGSPSNRGEVLLSPLLRSRTTDSGRLAAASLASSISFPCSCPTCAHLATACPNPARKGRGAAYPVGAGINLAEQLLLSHPRPGRVAEASWDPQEVPFPAKNVLSLESQAGAKRRARLQFTFATAGAGNSGRRMQILQRMERIFRNCDTSSTFFRNVSGPSVVKRQVAGSSQETAQRAPATSTPPRLPGTIDA